MTMKPQTLFNLGVLPLAAMLSWETDGLKTLPRILVQQRPGGDIHGEPGVVGFGNSLIGHEEVAGHFAILNPVGRARCGCHWRDTQEGQTEREQGGECLF